jgi:hypothetical protein
MATIASLEVQLSADTKNIIAGLEKATQEVKDFAQGTKVSLASARASFDLLKKAQQNATTTTELVKYNRAITELTEAQKGLANAGLNYSNAANKVQFTQQSFNQVLREAPAFAFSFQTGLLGISNNLPQLTDAFKAARAAGATNVEIFKQLGASLLSPINLIGIGIALLPQLSKAFGETKDRVQEYTEVVKKLKLAQTDIAGTIDKESFSLKTLVDIATNAASTTTQRKNALDSLQQLYPNYFGNLNAEKSSIADITAAYEKANKALGLRIQQQVLEGELLDLRKKQREAEKSGISDNVSFTQKSVLLLGAIFKDFNPFKPFSSGEKAANTFAETVVKTGARLKNNFIGQLSNQANTLEVELTNVANQLTNIEKVDLKGIKTTEDARKKAEADRKRRLKELEDEERRRAKASKDFFDKLDKERIAKNDPIKIGLAVPSANVLNAAAANVANATQFLNTLSFIENIKGAVEDYFNFVQERAALARAFITDFLTQPFNDFFNTIIEGSGNAFAAFGKALAGVIKELAVAVARAAALAVIINVVTGGKAGKIGSLFKSNLASGGGAGASLAALFGQARPSASGGVFTRPTNTLLGEQGPEAVIPLNRFNSLAGGLPQGGGGNQFIPIYRNGELYLQVMQSKRFVDRNG